MKDEQSTCHYTLLTMLKAQMKLTRKDITQPTETIFLYILLDWVVYGAGHKAGGAVTMSVSMGLDIAGTDHLLTEICWSNIFNRFF